MSPARSSRGPKPGGRGPGGRPPAASKRASGAGKNGAAPKGKPGAKGRPAKAAGRGRGSRPDDRSRPAPDRPAARRGDDRRPHPAERGRKVARGLGGEQVEGRQAVRELLLAGRRKVREVLVNEHDDEESGRTHEGLQDIVDLALDLHVPVREVSRARLLREARTEAPQGVLAMAEELPEVELEALAAVTKSSVPFLVAVDGVTDPGNLGTLIRSAECAGVTGFVLPRHRAVHITPAVTKASAGAIEYVPMAIVGGLPTAISNLRDLGVWIIGLDAGGDRPLFDLPVDADVPVCLVLGSEGKGISRLVKQRCDVLARLPLLGHLASLNVATAGTVACYEIARRRLT